MSSSTGWLCEAVPEQRLELIDGEVRNGIAKGTRHTAVVHRLIAMIQAGLEASPRLHLVRGPGDGSDGSGFGDLRAAVEQLLRDLPRS